MGMSQERLGEALGLTFQQVQKYERGVNRVGASRLFDLSRVLDVPISFFFDDMPEPLAGLHGGYTGSRSSGGFSESQDGFGTDEMLNVGKRSNSSGRITGSTSRRCASASST